MSSINVACTGSQPSSERVRALEAGASALKNAPSQPKCVCARSAGTDCTGTSRNRLSPAAGVAVFRIAFAQWVSESEKRHYDVIVAESIARLKRLAAS
jgi:hypothetical protein